MEGEKPEFVADDYGRFYSKDGVVQLAEPSEFDMRDILQAAQRYNPENDVRDMKRLGKKQELKRRFRFFTIGGYIMLLGLTWEFALTTSVFGLSNGGTAGAIWLNLAVCCFMFTAVLSMAEMASIAPTAGGQYHWVSELAPPKHQKMLSYIIGWLSALGWQTGLPGTAFIGAQQVVALISVCKSDYVYHSWHGSLLTIAFTFCAIMFNTVMIGQLPFLEGSAVILHFCGFIAIIVVFWVMGPRDDASVVFTQFTDANGWGSVGLATLLTIVGPLSTYLGADSAVHLAEELKDASYVLPRAMITSSLLNYALGFTTTVTFMMNLGNVDDLLDSATGQPWVALIQRITQSKAATIVFLCLMIIMYFFCAVNAVTTSSRQIWSFSRDKGLPFHKFLSKVRPKSGVPMNAVVVTMVITCLVALIIIGSTLAFNIILSISAAALLSSYVVVISCMLWRKLFGEPLPIARFRMPRLLGLVVNITAILFSVTATFFLFWPAAPDPTPASMNWVSLIYGVAVIFATCWYLIRGRHEYEGPVEYVRKDVL
ncbi:hypothetical protein PRZ48_014600 [Zasmidium cellare]|uniref:Amino acid transporter n=1 Tax=Zasmidium cellare TaxID=395010 RepID=A0ABR0DYS5_ZASCE|nr:hypothetical protein PRZ48_014600 [Zasmidium cellare]